MGDDQARADEDLPSHRLCEHIELDVNATSRGAEFGLAAIAVEMKVKILVYGIL